MADATKLPRLSDMTFFQWATPTAPNPRLTSPFDDDDTTLAFSSAPLDEDGVVMTEAFLLGIRKSNGYVETIFENRPLPKGQP